MSDRPLATEEEFTPEGIVSSTSLNRQEKLDRLNAMKMELGARQQDRQVDPATAEQEMFVIDSAIERVKSEIADDDGTALGRTPNG